jgi:glycosyltransferase involved in cell wall biosynthesis
VRVGVDATSWCNRRGFGRFVRNAVGRLVEVDRATTYVLYADDAVADSGLLPAGAEQRRVSLSGTVSRTGGRRATDLIRLTRAVREEEVDVFLFPSLHTYFPVRGVPTVVGLHDAIAAQLPRLALGGRRAELLWRAKQALAVRRATRLFTVSSASQQALSRWLKLTPERLALVPEAADPVFHPRSEREVAAALEALRLDPARPLLVYAAGISPHKNVETLLDAYAVLCREVGPAPQLVLAGELSYDSYLSAADAMRARINALALEGKVITPGFVSDDTLACLYSAATAAVVPSLAEGFGLPAVEAAACRTAVVLSDLPAHRESLDGAALYFPATDASALAERLQSLVCDHELNESFRERAHRAASRLSWDVSARRLRDVIAGAVG